MVLNFFQTETYGKFTSIIFVFVSLVPHRLIEIECRRNSSLLLITVVGPAEKLTIGIRYSTMAYLVRGLPRSNALPNLLK